MPTDLHQQKVIEWDKKIARIVCLCSAVGKIPEQIVAELRENFDYNIGIKTLRKVYKKELKDSLRQILAEIEQRVMVQAMNGCTRSQKLVLTLKGGWNPTFTLNINQPFPIIEPTYLDPGGQAIEAEFAKLEAKHKLVG